MNRSELRAMVFERDGYRCLWPACGKPAQELAHIHSIGMGGRKSADTEANTFASCRDHGRISDGEYGSGGREQYEAAHEVLGVSLVPRDRVAWERAEALVSLIAGRYYSGQNKEEVGGA